MQKELVIFLICLCFCSRLIYFMDYWTINLKGQSLKAMFLKEKERMFYFLVDKYLLYFSLHVLASS